MRDFDEGSRRGFSVSLAVVCSVLVLAGAGGCDRVEGIYNGLRAKLSSSPRKKPAAAGDRDKVLRKFGQPRERGGLGRAVHTENGVRYNRKWNYYYSSRSGKTPAMRTVYFVDDKFTGSVVRQGDGTIRKEDIRFPD